MTFYVNNVAGDDVNGDGTALLPWRTIQHAVDKVQHCYDFTCQPTIQLVTTSIDYAECVTLGRYVGSLCYPSGGGYTYPVIKGDPANTYAVQVRPVTGTPFTSVNGMPWILDSLLVASHSGCGVVSDAGSHLLMRNVNFGICAASHMMAEYGGFIETLAGPYMISGSANYHMSALMGGKWVAQGNPVAFTAPYGTWPAFYYFAQGGSGGLINMGQMSFASGGYTSAHPGTESNDGTALMYAPPSGWP